MKQRLKSLAVVIVTAALTAAGCSPNDKPSGGPEASGTGTQSAESSVLRIKDKGVTAKGGTVYVLQDGDFKSLDPANNYRTNAQEVGRLIYRTLTFIHDTPGEDPSIQPDLAETLGTPSDDRRTWTYRLRAGLKYEDGRPITAQDVKYGVMRSFDSDVFPLGATWMKDLLDNDAGFESPYATPEKDLSSVETPDDRTLIFHFSGSQSDADWIMSMPYTAPVPKDKDTKQAYSNRPVASGPYKIENYQLGTALSLVRNENWDPATDPNRPAYPDRFQFELNVDKAAASERLIKSDGNDAFAVPLDGILLVSDFARAQEPALKPRFVNGPGPCVDYITMNTQTIKDPDVRHAIALAIDRQSIQSAYGGDVYGSVADSVIPPGVPRYVAADLALKPGGDPDGAKKLLEGKSVPPLHIAVSDVPGAATSKETTQIETNLKAAGFEVVVDPHSDEDLSALVEGVEGWDIDPSGGWCFDWPTAASVVLPLMGPNDDGTTWGSSNPGKYFDPKFSDQLQDLRSSTEDSATTAKKFVDIANEIQTTAWPFLPTLHANDPEVVGANVTNVGISPYLSQVDLNTLAVKK
jgi:peptide/nickel transport system substrate-binding protein